MTKILIVALAGAVLLDTACGDPTPPAAPTPAPASITETFTGTLDPASTKLHSFTVLQVGKVQVSLTSVQPSAAVGLSVGTPSTSTGTCSAISTTTTIAGSSPQLSGTATVTGSFCVTVSDIGNLVEPVNYTVVVFHS